MWLSDLFRTVVSPRGGCNKRKLALLQPEQRDVLQLAISDVACPNDLSMLHEDQVITAPLQSDVPAKQPATSQRCLLTLVLSAHCLPLSLLLKLALFACTRTLSTIRIRLFKWSPGLNQRVSIAADAENLESLSQLAQIPLFLIDTPRCHTLVTLSTST